MIIAIEGCAHGALEEIYAAIALQEKQNGIIVDLLLVCGDFQSTRNEHDLATMACPPKYREMCSFYKYYSGELVAPITTVFIGGNHEASNYLTELWHGGWAAPNIYYLGNNGVVTFGGITIAGLSGIYKSKDYYRGWNETFPLNRNHERSIYHVRDFQTFQLKQMLGTNIDIFLSHDWPVRACKCGDTKFLIQRKPHFRQDISNNVLGSPPAQELLDLFKPTYWFSAHLHFKFPAIFQHENSTTRFLGLDKCLPRRNFLQIIKVDAPKPDDKVLRYHPKWLAVLRLTQPLCKLGLSAPLQMDGKRDNFQPTEEEIEETMKQFGDDMIKHSDFVATVPVITDLKRTHKGKSQPLAPNPQTQNFCKRLGLKDMWVEKFSPKVEAPPENDEWDADLF